MKKLLTLFLVLSILPLFSGSPKGIYVGILQQDGVTEYDEESLNRVTFYAWLEQGSGPVIIEPTLGTNSLPIFPYTEVIQLDDPASAVAMVATRGTVQFNLQEFSTWDVGNILHVWMKDDGRDCYDEMISWVIDDVTLAPKGIGMEPFMAGTGRAIVLYSCGSIDGYTPMEIKLEQIYPNPFNPTTTINFSIVNSGNVNLNVYNFSGQLVNSLVSGQMSAGSHTVNFDASNLSAGVYYYTLEANSMTMTNKMVLVK